jgi:DNA-binding Lrp family transcriptional regulator
MLDLNFDISFCYRKYVTVAYVMINCELGAEETIMEKLREIEQVKEVFGTIGTHDMMVKLEAENFEKIREIASRSIQKIEKIRTISTLIKKDQ